MVRQEKEAIRSRTKLQDKAHLDSVRLRNERVTRLNQLQVSSALGASFEHLSFQTYRRSFQFLLNT